MSKLVQVPGDPTTKLLNDLNHLTKQSEALRTGDNQVQTQTPALTQTGKGNSTFIINSFNNEKQLRVKASNYREAVKKAIMHLNPPADGETTSYQVYPLLPNKSEEECPSKLFEITRKNKDGKIVTVVDELN